MDKTSFIIKKNFYAQIEIYISRDPSTKLSQKDGSVTLALGGATSEDPDATSFMVTAILTVGKKEDNFYCKVDQRIIVEGTEKTTDQLVEKWITQEKEFLYQMLREKMNSLLGAEVEIMNMLPNNFAEMERGSL